MTYLQQESHDCPVESCKITVILFGSMLPNQKRHCRGLNSRNHGMAHPLNKQYVN